MRKMRLTGSYVRVRNELPFEHTLLSICIIAPFARLIDRYTNEDGSHKNPSICIFPVPKNNSNHLYDRNKIFVVKSTSVLAFITVTDFLDLLQCDWVGRGIAYLSQDLFFKKYFRKHLCICSRLHLIWCLSMIIDNSHRVWSLRQLHLILNRHQ